MASLLRIAWVTALGLSSAASFAQLDTAPTAKLQFDKAPIVAGKTFKATLVITFADGLHGYQNPPTDPDLIPVVIKAADKVFSVVSVAYPKGTLVTMPGESKPVGVYSGTIKIPVTLKAPTKLGKTPLKLVFNYQQCNDRACFPPSSVNISASVTVGKAAKTTPKAGS